MYDRSWGVLRLLQSSPNRVLAACASAHVRTKPNRTESTIELLTKKLGKEHLEISSPLNYTHRGSTSLILKISHEIENFDANPTIINNIIPIQNRAFRVNWLHAEVS